MSRVRVMSPGASGGDTAPGLQAVWLRLGLAFLGFAALAFFGAMLADSADWWLHAAWCVVGMAVTLPVLVGCLSRGFAFVLTDHFVMFTAAFSLYFLFGACFLVFGNAEEVGRVLSYYSVDAVGALRADAMNAVGFGIALLVGVASSRKWFSRMAAIASSRARRVPAFAALALLLAFGLASFFYTLLYDFGFREGVVPGLVRAAANFALVAIFLSASFTGRGAPALRLAAVLLAVILAGAGLLMFNKTQVLVSLGALVAGLAMVYPARRILPAGLAGIVAVYLAIGGAVAYGRNTSGDRLVSVAERWNLIREGLAARAVDDSSAAVSSWGRLCYVPSQAAGMDFYDRGFGAEDFALLPWLLVPRLLVPDKPIITETPQRFHEKISGHAGSSTGQGVFSSGYYSGGWLGVLAAAVLAGWVLAQTSAVAEQIIRENATLLLPFALYGVYIAFRIDGAFLADYAGAFVFILYPALAIWLTRLPLQRSAR